MSDSGLSEIEILRNSNLYVQYTSVPVRLKYIACDVTSCVEVQVQSQAAALEARRVMHADSQ